MNDFVKIFCFTFFISLFFSCSNSAKNDFLHDEDLLKDIAEKKQNEITWTDELEGDRLIQQINTYKTIEKNIKLNPSVFLNSKYSSELKSLYPYLEGFSSLDLSSLDLNIKAMTKDFIEGLCSYSFSTSGFKSEDIFEYSLLLKDLKDKWKDFFNCEFPEKTETNLILFDEYFIGQGIEMFSLYEVPVRLVRNDTGFVDVIIYFYFSNDSWKINQLSLLKMEKFDVTK